MTVVDLEERVIADLPQLVRRDGPAEVRMVDVGDAVLLPDGIHVSLKHVDHGRAALRRHHARDVQAVDVQRLVAEAIRHLLALDDEELLVGAVQRVERVDRREKVVIGEHEKLVPVLAIPAHDLVRRAVAVAVQRVRVGVALEPAGLRG